MRFQKKGFFFKTVLFFSSFSRAVLSFLGAPSTNTCLEKKGIFYAIIDVKENTPWKCSTREKNEVPSNIDICERYRNCEELWYVPFFRESAANTKKYTIH